jgi:hypothetical protein
MTYEHVPGLGVDTLQKSPISSINTQAITATMPADFEYIASEAEVAKIEEQQAEALKTAAISEELRAKQEAAVAIDPVEAAAKEAEAKAAASTAQQAEIAEKEAAVSKATAVEEAAIITKQPELAQTASTEKTQAITELSILKQEAEVDKSATIQTEASMEEAARLTAELEAAKELYARQEAAILLTETERAQKESEAVDALRAKQEAEIAEKQATVNKETAVVEINIIRDQPILVEAAEERKEEATKELIQTRADAIVTEQVNIVEAGEKEKIAIVENKPTLLAVAQQDKQAATTEITQLQKESEILKNTVVSDIKYTPPAPIPEPIKKLISPAIVPAVESAEIKAFTAKVDETKSNLVVTELEAIKLSLKEKIQELSQRPPSLIVNKEISILQSQLRDNTVKLAEEQKNYLANAGTLIRASQAKTGILQKEFTQLNTILQAKKTVPGVSSKLLSGLQKQIQEVVKEAQVTHKETVKTITNAAITQQKIEATKAEVQAARTFLDKYKWHIIVGGLIIFGVIIWKKSSKE